VQDFPEERITTMERRKEKMAKVAMLSAVTNKVADKL